MRIIQFNSIELNSDLLTC